MSRLWWMLASKSSVKWKGLRYVKRKLRQRPFPRKAWASNLRRWALNFFLSNLMLADGICELVESYWLHNVYKNMLFCVYHLCSDAKIRYIFTWWMLVFLTVECLVFLCHLVLAWEKFKEFCSYLLYTNNNTLVTPINGVMGEGEWRRHTAHLCTKWLLFSYFGSKSLCMLQNLFHLLASFLLLAPVCNTPVSSFALYSISSTFVYFLLLLCCDRIQGRRPSQRRGIGWTMWYETNSVINSLLFIFYSLKTSWIIRWFW